MRRSWFWTWAATVGLLAISVLAITSFGMFLLPGALLMVGIAAVRARFWPDILGALDGIGVALLWPALVNWGMPQCQPGLIMTMIATERGEFSGGGCTTIDYRLWAFSGLALMLVGFAGHRVARRRAYATRTSEPVHSDERRAREMAPPWLVGPLAATGALIALLYVGFLASAGGMVVAGMLAFVVGTVAAMFVDSHWRRNAAIVAAYVTMLLSAHVLILQSLSVPPGAMQGGPAVSPPQ